MGRLTDEMTRLVGEIHTASEERKRSVAGMLAGFRSAHAEMARRQQQMLREFVSSLRVTVAGMRNQFAEDIAGAHKAWFGGVTAAMPGRARRGGKWFGGERA